VAIIAYDPQQEVGSWRLTGRVSPKLRNLVLKGSPAEGRRISNITQLARAETRFAVTSKQKIKALVAFSSVVDWDSEWTNKKDEKICVDVRL